MPSKDSVVQFISSAEPLKLCPVEEVFTALALYARERPLDRHEERSEEKGKAFLLLNNKMQLRQNLPS